MDRRTFIESLCASVAAPNLRSLGRGNVLVSAVSEIAFRDEGAVSSTIDNGATLSLAAEWRLCLDPENAGNREQWFKDATHFVSRIPLPGSTDEYHFGQFNEKRESERLSRTFEFTGPVWYQCDVAIPESWNGKRVALYLERCHWETRAWLDDRPIGLRNSLSTPHIFELGIVSSARGNRNGADLTPGHHRLTVRVDNRMKVDIGLSSATTPEVGATWNGIIGRMELQSTDQVWIESLLVYPLLVEDSIRVKVQVRNLTGESHSAEMVIAGGMSQKEHAGFETRAHVIVSNRPTTTIDHIVKLSNAPRWSEFSPDVFYISALLTEAKESATFQTEAKTCFGMREVSMAGKQLKLNGRTISLRGTVDNGTFPQKGYVPTDVAFWRERLRIYRDYGFNHVRFHSWCPPDAAFTAADELGILFQVENPMWIPDGRVSDDEDRMEFIRDEANKIVDTYGNHPSFGLMSMGNEEGSGQDVFLGDLVADLQVRDSRHLYTSTTHPDNIGRPDNYFVSAGINWSYFRGDPRLENNPPDTELDYGSYIAKAKIDRPLIAHELGQWTVFPNLNEEKDYDGPLQPRYFDIYREELEQSKLLDLAESFRKSSGSLTVALYKEEIEAVLRTQDLSGFQLLGLTDFPGFGPAFVGVLDTLSKSKGLITPAEFRRFCSPTVPLLRLSKRIWTRNETLVAPLEVAHYGLSNLERAKIFWTIRDTSGNEFATGSLSPLGIQTGGLTRTGEIKLPLNKLVASRKYSIECSVNEAVNSWNIWIYPQELPAAPQNIRLTNEWNESLGTALQNGETLVLSLGSKKLVSGVPCSFTTIFWASSLFPSRHETMGILCDPGHPALRLFATDSHSDWQWWELTSKSQAFNLTALPVGFQPIVRVIDDATKSRRLGAVIEAKVGRGKLLATSFDLENNLVQRASARQLRASLLSYAASEEFQPECELTISELDGLFSIRAD